MPAPPYAFGCASLGINAAGVKFDYFLRLRRCVHRMPSKGHHVHPCLVFAEHPLNVCSKAFQASRSCVFLSRFLLAHIDRCLSGVVPPSLPDKTMPGARGSYLDDRRFSGAGFARATDFGDPDPFRRNKSGPRESVPRPSSKQERWNIVQIRSFNAHVWAAHTQRERERVESPNPSPGRTCSRESPADHTSEHTGGTCV